MGVEGDYRTSKATLGLLQAQELICAPHCCRFPRFVRIRDDKRVEEASGPDEICELFRAQTRKMGSTAAPAPVPASDSQ